MADFLKICLVPAIWLFAMGGFCFAQTPPIFNVKTYGAVGDGVTLDSPAVNAAIAAAGAAGGGTVTFPPGTYLCGSIHLTNCMANLTLYLSNNAVIWGSETNIDPHESNPYSQYQDDGHSYFHDGLIWGENLQNFTIAGPGKIDGNGSLTTGDPSSTTPGDKALCLVLCSNVTIIGITITNGGHFGILAQACTNMLVSGARIWESTARDGFNLICSSYVVVTNCDIEGSDDSMCLKSTYALGRVINAQNIHIVNCQILSTQNNATQFGSETVGNFSDVTFSNLALTGAGKAGIGITSQDGSIIDGVTYDNIIMSNCACPIFLKLDYRTTDSPYPSVGAIRNISINNVTAYHSTDDGRINTSTINGFYSNSAAGNTFTTSGTWTCPAGVTSVTVQCWGGGGAGGSGTNGNTSANAAGGGGGGAFAQSTLSVTPGTQYTVTVGAGGASTSPTTGTLTGGSGGNSWFGGPSAILAAGGAGGSNSTAVAIGGIPVTLEGIGGPGGSAASSIGTFVYSGGNGFTPTADSSGGGGGGSAGTNAAGNSAASITGATAVVSGGAGGTGGTGSANGNAGSPPGGGGGGEAGGTSLRSGGAGATGQVIITYSNSTFATIIPIENITFNNVNVSNIGGDPVTAITNYPVENYGDWQPQDFGNWPCYGWYLRWAANISFTNCQVHFDNNDDRPAVIADTVTNVLFESFTADAGKNNTNYDMEFLQGANFDVTNATASATAPTPGTALRIYNGNSTPALIVSPPYFSPGDGLYTSTQSVVVASGTPGASIRYTMDGTTPTSTSGTIYSGPVAISSETVLRAIAYINGMVDSAVNTAIYYFSSGTPTVAVPIFSPGGGTYAAAQAVTINCATVGASIRYTTDGSTPATNHGTLYFAPVAISSNTTLEAFAYASNMLNSAVNIASYVITGAAAAPVFSPPGGAYTNAQAVTVTSATSDAAIRYTTDGSIPTPTTGTLYSVPVTISSNATLNAIAYADGASNSTVASSSYVFVPPPPVFAFEAESLPYVTNGAPAVLQNDTTFPSGHWLALEATATNEWIEYTIPDIAAGTYDIQMVWKGNNDRGIISFALDGTVLGNPLDQYSSGETYPTTDYGIVTFTNSGTHAILLTAVGKNPSSSSYWISTYQFLFIQLQAGLPQSPHIAGGATLSGTNLFFNGTNGIPSATYYVLASTNLSLPLTSWEVIATNVFDAGGNFTFSNAPNASGPEQFYLLKCPLLELP
jgi:hypothetical protein